MTARGTGVRAVAQMFGTSFLRGASTLLESYDAELAVPPATTVVTTEHPARTEPTASWPLAA